MHSNNDLNNYTDQDLLKLYQGGNFKAFEVLYNKYSSKIYGYLLSKLKNKSHADDLLQIVFLKFHNSRLNYEPKYSLQSWLFTMSYCALIDNHRKDKSHLEDSNSETIENLVHSDDNQPEIEINLDKLNQKQKTIIELRYLDGYSFDEIATKINSNPSNVRKIISRAISSLRLSLNSTKGEKHES